MPSPAIGRRIVIGPTAIVFVACPGSRPEKASLSWPVTTSEGAVGRFAAVLVLAVVGLVWLLLASLTMRVALLNGFVAGAVLPLVMNPTRHWRQAFWRCVDLTWAAAFIGASMAAHSAHLPQTAAFTASLAPALLFGTMASLGVGRSGLADVER